MSIIADFSVPADAFCFAETLATLPEITAELDRLVAYSPDHVMPFIWILDADQDAVDAALVDDPTVVTAATTDAFDDALLYQVTWSDVVSDRLQVILDHDGVVLEARGHGDEWRLEVRFGSREHFSTFEEHFGQYGELTLHQLASPQTPGATQYGVTTEQREALLMAYDAGYYEIPSETTGEEIAQNLSISQQSFSRRLKRGVATLIEDTIDRHRDE
jgi:hypothetical protein